MTDILAVLRAELTDAEAARPRALQVETGASQVFGCRAETVLRLNGTPLSDPRLSWGMWVGNAIHERLAEQLAGPDRVTEQSFVYRGVQCTVDHYDKASETVTDWKTKADAAAIRAVVKDGPSETHRAQVHLGAAALIEAGHSVSTVQLVYLPRSGDLDDARVWSAPFDRTVADRAAEWAHLTGDLAAARSGLHPLSMVEGLRDKPASWCHRYCGYATLCRGAPLDEPVFDGYTASVAADYWQADQMEKEATARKKELRGVLLGLRGIAGEFQITTSGGGWRTVEQEDIAALRELWTQVYGDTKPVPTLITEEPSTQRLSVRPVKP